MRSLLSGIAPADIRLAPFPHVIVPDVLDEEIHRALNESYPPFPVIGWAGSKPPGSNRRYQLSAWPIIHHPDLPQVWKDFVTLHASPAFFAEVVALFHDHWPAALKEALDGDLLGHPMGMLMRDSYETVRILQDARMEINTPVTAGPSSSRGPHLDMPNRLFTCLYYLRHPDDDAVGGDLELFRWKNGPVADIEGYALPAESVEVAAVVPYRANQMVIFPQGIDAIHGVGVRHPTPHTRRYVFISAEIERSWLVSPTAPAWA
ncbi:2OG-Fe(II) oxygenase [Azospirillum sp. B506]|uniref:2OG-Fe(II) oxygenase n=1 Tax=Azospirillum sp. B506 TaxID=137721 RepID=UPI00034A9882|nr:2OG-Fe(II) oxygenase [Azospirillum sp. B506]